MCTVYKSTPGDWGVPQDIWSQTLSHLSLYFSSLSVHPSLSHSAPPLSYDPSFYSSLSSLHSLLSPSHSLLTPSTLCSLPLLSAQAFSSLALCPLSFLCCVTSVSLSHSTSLLSLPLFVQPVWSVSRWAPVSRSPSGGRAQGGAQLNYWEQKNVCANGSWINRLLHGLTTEAETELPTQRRGRRRGARTQGRREGGQGERRRGGQRIG